MNYSLPKTVEIEGNEYPVRTDFRDILEIFTALNDPELTKEEKAVVVMNIFFEEVPEMALWEQALKEFVLFINMGEEEPKRMSPKLMDWEQDFKYIIAPINRVMGKEVRSIEYVHWWTFLSAYYEIGECTFSQIISIRDKQSKHKPLEKWEKEWYRDHKDIVDFKTRYSQAEEDLLKQWGA